MMVKKGTLYGVGIGPGDPELITLKALKIINNTKHIAFPGKVREDTLCIRIASDVMENPDDKVYISCPVPMTKDRAILEESYEYAKAQITKVLDGGEDVAFLNLGDPTVYATYMYVHKKVKEEGYDAVIINGVTSFCAAAARLSTSLGMRADMIHIIPGSYPVEEALRLPGTKVLMKSAKKIGSVKQLLLEHDGSVNMVENCGLPNERVFFNAEEIDENSGYMSVIIVKDKDEECL